MSKSLFSEEEIKQLNKNKYVLKVSTKAITYTDEFKLHFIFEYNNEKQTRTIFEEAGLSVEMIGFHRVMSSAKRWRKSFKEKGIMGLSDTRKANSGRPLERELNSTEIIKRKDAEIAYLKAELEIVKKLELDERQVKNNKLQPWCIFSLIEDTIKKYSLKNMVLHLCKIADVSRSGYYNYLKMADIRNQKEENDLIVRDIILKAFQVRGYKKGSRSIKMYLENEMNIIYSRKRIQRIMRKYKIVCPFRKANPYKRMAKATKEHRVVPNILNRNFKQETPGKVLLTDITYMPYNNGDMAYLSTIKDASTNEILAYQLSKRITLDIVTRTIEKLSQNKKINFPKGAFIHSDQGVHYTSPSFQRLLKKHNFSQSMSRRGNCWDNAPQESFFGHMKDEIDYKSCKSFVELKYMVDDYMDYYNNYRYQWNLKKLTPVKYRNQLLAA